MIHVQFKKFSDHARTPEYAHEGDAGADLYVASLATEPLWPNETRIFWSDIGVELPTGYMALVLPRSSVSKRGLLVAVGLVDSSFRGNVGITCTNLTREPQPVPRGTKIAQLAILPVASALFEQVEELSETARGVGGFGITNKR